MIKLIKNPLRNLSIITLATMLSFFSSSAHVLAAGIDFQLNDIRIYDPNATDPISCGGGELVGNDNLARTFNYFKTKGLSDAQAAGVVGNVIEESGGDPTIIQGGKHSNNPSDAGGGGYGVIQWTPGKSLLDFMEQFGINGEPYLLQTQLDVIWQHMTVISPPSITKMLTTQSPMWKGRQHPPYIEIDDERHAAIAFHDTIERSGDTETGLEERRSEAENAMRLYGSAQTGPVIPIDGEVDPCNNAAYGSVVETALSYAWPEQHSRPHYDMKPAYKTANDAAIAAGEYVGGGANRGIDCGGFVTRVMRNSGVDPQYNSQEGNTTAQQNYLHSSDKYEQISATSTADLQTGDIAIRTSYNAHTYIYLGSKPDGTAYFPNGELVVEASIGDQSYGPGGGLAPQAGFSAGYHSSYEYFRLVSAETPPSSAH